MSTGLPGKGAQLCGRPVARQFAVSPLCCCVSCGRFTSVKVCIQVYEGGSELHSVCSGLLPSARLCAGDFL